MSTVDRLLDRVLGRLLMPRLEAMIAHHERRRPHVGADDLLDHHRLFGERSRLRLHPTAVVNDALFNTESGTITVGEHAFFGHNVSVLTGTHDVSKFGAERQRSVPKEGRDVVIEEGAWVASNATVVGPCRVGAHAVVGACSLVQEDVEPYTIVAGVPAKLIRRIEGGDGGEPSGD